MNAAALLKMVKAEGVTLVLVGNRLTWEADHQPPADLLSTVKEYRQEVIIALSTVGDPPIEQTNESTRLVLTAATASPEWVAIRDRFHNHIWGCRTCYAPAGRYCGTGAELHQEYDLTPME